MVAERSGEEVGKCVGRAHAHLTHTKRVSVSVTYHRRMWDCGGYEQIALT